MAFITYRQNSSDPGRVASSVKNLPLTNVEVDGNFKVIDMELALKANVSDANFTTVITAVTPALSSDSTAVATTAYVVDRIAQDAPSKTGTGASGTWDINISGAAGSANTLQTPRTINGVSFDGSANINISTSGEVLTRGTYLTGSNYNGDTATTWAVDATSAATASKVVARDASGDFAANVITAVDFNTTSDARLKENIVPVTDALNKVSQLHGVTYNLKADTGTRHVGLLAQDVLAVVPEAVTGSEDTQYGVSYGNLVGVLVEAIKELQARIILLEAK